MSRYFVRAVVLLGGTALGLSAQSTSLPTFWRYSHPDAKALVGIDVKSIGESPFGTRLLKEFAEAGFKAKAQAEGFDFLNETERLLLSSPGTAPGAGKNSAPFVIALQGRFDLPKIRAFVKSKGATRSFYKKVELLSPEDGAKGQDFVMALVGPQTIVVGDPASVKAALDHHSAADVSASANPLYQRAVELAGIHDVWFTSEVSPSSLSEGNPAMAMFAEVQGFEGGLSFRSGLGLEVILNTASSEGAQKLAGGVQALLQMAALGADQEGAGGKRANPAELLKKLRVGSDATQVKFALSFDQAELDRGIDEMKASFRTSATQTVAGIQTRPGQTAPAVKPQPEIDPATPLVIKIYNSDGGTREIPFVR